MTAAAISLKWKRGIWAAFSLVIGVPLLLQLTDISAWPNLAGPLYPSNPDVWLRLKQALQWIGGGDFFSHAVRGTNAPEGGLESHWTRPLDIILAGFYSLTPSRHVAEFRMLIAAAWYPLVLCLTAALLMATAARRIFRHNHVLACTLLLFLCSPYMADYFKPGDADHHGLMSVLWCGVLALLVRRVLTPVQALSIGALLGGIIWISPEGLLIYAVTLAVLGVEAILAPRQDRTKIDTPVLAAGGAAIVVTTGLLMELPLRGIFAHLIYDSLSVIHVAASWIVVAVTCMLSVLWRRTQRRNLLILQAAIAAFAGMTGIYLLYPRFFKGPLADADPYILTDFLPAVSEAKPLLAASFSHYAPTLLLPLLAMALLAGVFRQRRRAARLRPLFILSAVLAAMLLMTMVQTRWAYYLAPVSIILCAGLLPTVSIATLRFAFAPRRWQPYLWIAVLATYIGGTLAATVSMHQAGTASAAGCLSEIRYVIQTQQLQNLLGRESDIFYTYEDVGTEMLFFTPYRIIASNYHREGRGLRDLKAMREAPDIDAFHALLNKRKVDTLLVCPVYHPRFFPAGAALPAWLHPVEGMRFYLPQGDKPLLLRVEP